MRDAGYVCTYNSPPIPLFLSLYLTLLGISRESSTVPSWGSQMQLPPESVWPQYINTSKNSPKLDLDEGMSLLFHRGREPGLFLVALIVTKVLRC